MGNTGWSITDKLMKSILLCSWSVYFIVEAIYALVEKEEQTADIGTYKKVPKIQKAL